MCYISLVVLKQLNKRRNLNLGKGFVKSSFRYQKEHLSKHYWMPPIFTFYFMWCCANQVSPGKENLISIFSYVMRFVLRNWLTRSLELAGLNFTGQPTRPETPAEADVAVLRQRLSSSQGHLRFCYSGLSNDWIKHTRIIESNSLFLILTLCSCKPHLLSQQSLD